MEPIDFIEKMGSIPGAIAAVSLVALSAWSAGQLLRNCLRDSRLLSGADAVLYSVAGLNAVACFGMVLGTSRLLTGRMSLLFLSLVALAGVCSRVFFSHSRMPVSIYKFLLAFRLRPVYLISVPFFGLTLGPALCFPSGWDELVYHSVLPQRWMLDDWPAVYDDLPYSGFPSQVEVLCWLVAPIEAVITSRLAVWTAWIAGLFLLHACCCQITNNRLATVITLALAASPTSLLISANCYVEAFLFLNLAAIFKLWASNPADELTDGERVRPILLGILVGGAASVKLTGIFALIIPLVLYAVHRTPEVGKVPDVRTLLATARPIMRTAIAFLVIAIPFYLRPWAITGNPFYPYFASLWTTDTNEIAVSQFHHAIGSEFGMRGALAFLATPLLIAFDGELFDGSLGWQYLVFVGLACSGLYFDTFYGAHPVAAGSANAGCFKRRNEKRNKSLTHSNLPRNQSQQLCHCLLIALLAYVFWFFTSQQARFAILVLTCLTIAAACGFSVLSQQRQLLASAVLCLTTIVSLPWINAGYYFASWESIIGIWNQTEYVSNSTDDRYLQLVRAVSQLAPQNSHILLVFEHRSFYIPWKCTIGTPFFQPNGLTPPDEFGDPDRFRDFLMTSGITHIVFATQPVGPDQSAHWWNRMEPIFRLIESEIAKGRLTIIWSGEPYLLLRISLPGSLGGS